MKRAPPGRWRWIVFLYFLSYLPNVIITKLVTSTPNPALGRPLTGLETLPASLILNMVLTYLFIWLVRAGTAMRTPP